jgi:hypothetical protein
MPQDTPDPQVVPCLLYADAGAVRHGELLLDHGGVIMLGSHGTDFRGPARLGEVTQM